MSHDTLTTQRSLRAAKPIGPNVERAFAQAWERYRGDLYRACLSWSGGRPAEADEALARSGMLALQKFREYGSELGNVRAWLLKLSYNVCMDMHRERRRRREDSLDDAGAVLSAASSGGDPEQRYLDIERRARLEQWVGELPARLRGPMTLYLHRHMRYREIARDLGITEVNVRKRRQEARDILRERFRSSQ